MTHIKTFNSTDAFGSRVLIIVNQHLNGASPVRSLRYPAKKQDIPIREVSAGGK